MIKYMELDKSKVTTAYVSLVRVDDDHACNFAITFSEDFDVDTLKALEESLGTFRHKIQKLLDDA